MSKKNNSFDFGSFLKTLESATVTPPVVEGKQERRYFLIVSEGIRTEPIYFKYWSKKLPKNLINTIEVHGAGDNTLNVVKKAIELREKRRCNPVLPDYDEVWAIFDKDDFPADRYNEAISFANHNGIQSGHSNESFELWYVLHFEYLQAEIKRDDYIKKLSKHLGYRYLKNSLKVVNDIFEKGDIIQAISRAKQLERLHEGKTGSDSCPHTRLYVLVERLLDYANLK